MIARSDGRRVAAGVILGISLAAFAWADRSFGVAATVFHAIAQLFYEKSQLAELREPSQIALFRTHGAVLGVLVASGLICSPWLTRHARRWWAIFAVAYAIRAAIWIAGSNLPLVPGDSCHYVEIASSIYHGEGPVKHYVESFFTDYSQKILRTGAVLDDWATPLFAYLLAIAYRVTGVVPGDSLEATFAVAKGLSFALNLLTFPALYLFARRRWDRGHRPRIHRRAGNPAGSRPVRRLRASRKPGGADVGPSRLDLDGGLGSATAPGAGDGRWHRACSRGWRSSRATRQWPWPRPVAFMDCSRTIASISAP